jgi:hypothetical protein
VTEVWEYLQENVMGECWHEFSTFEVTNEYGTDVETKCCKCQIKSTYENRLNRDFSTPTDYCALEDKMRGTSEWDLFCGYLFKQCKMLAYITHTPAQRAKLIAEYWRR